MPLFWKCAKCESKSLFWVKSFDGMCENCYKQKIASESIEEETPSFNEPTCDNAESSVTNNIDEDVEKPNFKTDKILLEPWPVYQNSLLVYTYICDVCVLRDTEDEVFSMDFKSTDFLYFESEPDNTYDPFAVAIKLNSKKIGYVYKGQFQDMINDWLKRDHEIVAKITEVDFANKKIFYQISFYKPFSILDHKTFPLIKMKAKDWSGESRYDNAINLEVGEQVDINYDGLDEPCVVESVGLEVGELNQAAKEYIESLLLKGREIVGVVEETDYDDNLNFKCKISIYDRRPI